MPKMVFNSRNVSNPQVDDGFEIDDQFGHSKQTGASYGTSNIDIFLATGSKGLAQSEAWHEFFSLKNNSRVSNPIIKGFLLTLSTLIFKSSNYSIFSASSNYPLNHY